MKLKHWILVALATLSSATMAQQYCLEGPVGYGASTTGGTGKSVKTVKTQSELATAVKNGNATIVITQDINLSSVVEAKGSNYTLIAMPGVTLTNSNNTKDGSGILYMKGANNVILRNLTLKGPGSHDVNGRDNLTVENCTNVWVDHCDIMDGCDGNFDITKTSDNISVTWCRFRYTKSGDHNFSNLVGSTPIKKGAEKGTDYPNDGFFNVTYAGCWWDEGCVERMTRTRFAQIQFVNCYWKSSTAKLYFGAGCNAYGYFDGCYMNKHSKYCQSYTSDDGGGSCAWKFVNSVMPGGTLSNSGTMNFTPTSLESTEWGTIAASDVPSVVSNSTCGAGATLQVTQTTGKCSSSCGGSSASVAVTGVELNKTSLTLSIGNSETLTATVSPNNAANKAVNWSSNNPSVASVNNGVVNAVAAGVATITATTVDGNKTATCSVTVLSGGATPVPLSENGTWWNFSDVEFSNLGELTSNRSINGLTIYATSSKNFVIDANDKSYGDSTFSARGKSGGVGSLGEYRCLEFDVPGDCLIEIYAMCSSSSKTATLEIQKADGTPLNTQSVPGTSLNYLKYNYTGSAATIDIFSSVNGVNFYGVKMTPSSCVTDVMDAASVAKEKYVVARIGVINVWNDGSKTISQ